MNVPASNFTEPHFGNIPLACVYPSKTNPRKHFDEAALAELAESIKQHGVAQPILVRPLPTTETMIDCVEIVAGERRFRASKLAGKETIPAIVRELTDQQALEIQVIENLQRQDVHPIEEAEGYDQLMKEFGLTADQLAEKVGKSRSYIYGRLKFCALAPAAREAFFEGKLSASTALLIARIPSPELQEKATQELTDEDDPLSYRQAVEYLQQRYMLNLATAPFSLTDAKLVLGAGSCNACPKRTGNQPELYADVKRADVCTDPDCFAMKRIAHGAKTIEKAKKKGIPVYESDEVDDSPELQELSSIDDSLWNFERRCAPDPWKKVSDLLAVDDRPPPAALVKHKDGKIEELYDKTTMQEALEKAGLCETVEQRQAREQTKIEEAGASSTTAATPKVPTIDVRAIAAEQESKVRLEAYKRIRATASDGLPISMFRAMLKVLLGQFDYSKFSLPDELLGDLYDFDTSSEDKIFEYIDQAPMPVPQVLMMDAIFGPGVDVDTYDMNEDGTPDAEDYNYLAFVSLTEAAGVDLDAIRKELAPAPAAEEAAPPPEDAPTEKKPRGRKKKATTEVQESQGEAPAAKFNADADADAAAWPFPTGGQP